MVCVTRRSLRSRTIENIKLIHKLEQLYSELCTLFKVHPHSKAIKEERRQERRYCNSAPHRLVRSTTMGIKMGPLLVVKPENLYPVMREFASSEQIEEENRALGTLVNVLSRELKVYKDFRSRSQTPRRRINSKKAKQLFN